MLDQWSDWVFSSRFRRRALIKAWRRFLRVERATLASAVVVVRRQDGRVLALQSISGELQLPIKELDGWQAVTTQVEEWLEELLQDRQTAKLVAIEGTPSHHGVTFLYSAEVPYLVAGGVWLDADAALPVLNARDREFLLLSRGSAPIEAGHRKL
jgi:hypothetical protein